MPMMHRFHNLALALLMVFAISGTAVGQNGLIGAGFGTNDWSTTDCFGGGAGTSRIGTYTANGTGNQYFRMSRCWGGDFTQYAQPGCTDLAISPETEIGSLTACGAGAYYLNVSSTSDNYVFKTPDGAGGTSFIVFRVQGTVNTVTAVSASAGSLVMPGATNTITATVSGGGTLPTGQGVYVRYTTDGWASSTVAEMTYSGSGADYNYTVGAGVHTAGTTVNYYILTSGDGLTISHANADWYAINIENNGGGNYTYNVPSCTPTIATGDWDVGATWSGGVPAEGSTVCLLHDVTMDDNHTVTDLYLDAGVELADATHTLTVNGDVFNYGTHSGTGKMFLNGGAAMHNLSGGGSYGNLDLDDANNAQIADGGTVADLTITNGSLTMTGASSLDVTGEVMILGTLALSTTLGGDIFVDGDWTRGAAGTFTPNGRMVAFDGTALQTISVSGGGTETFAYLRCDKASGDLRIDDSPATDVTVSGAAGDVLQLGNGILDLNGRTMTLSGTGGNVLVENGARTISGGTGSTLIVNGTPGNTNKTVTRNDGSSTLTLGTDVALEVLNGGIDFGTALTTVNGSFELQTQGYVANNSPSYGNASTLIYNAGGTFARRIEWNDASLQNVTVKNGTTLDMYTFDAASQRSMAGNLLIESGAGLNCGVAPTNRTADIVIGGNLTVEGTLDMQETDKASIDVGGNVTITGTLELSDLFGGDIKVAGDFTNNGTFTCNDRALFLDGTAAQNVSGSSAIDIDYLFVQNTGAGITLQRAVSITDTLHLDTGVIFTTDANLLTLTAAAAMSSSLPGSAVSYVDGPMAKDFASTTMFVYPLGESGTWAPVGIEPTSAVATTYKANYALNNPHSDGYDNTSLEVGIDHVSQIEYWDVQRPSGSADCKLRLYYGTHSVVSNNPQNASLLVAHWSSGDSEWKNEGSSAVSGDATSGYVESNTVTSFSPFTLASSDANNPLPVELVRFDAQLESDLVALQWVTASERQNQLFTVERASDPNGTFAAIGSLPGAGTTAMENRYQLFDKEPLAGWNYYRLRQTDLDGTSSLSNIQAVYVASNAGFTAYSTGREMVISSTNSVTANLTLIDASGRIVWRQQANLAAGSNALALPAHLNSGLYYLLVRNGQHQFSTRFAIGQ